MKIGKRVDLHCDVVSAQAAARSAAARDAAGPSGRLTDEMGQLALSLLHVSYKPVPLYLTSSHIATHRIVRTA